MRRIFYFCPDFPQPSGGVKTLYRHVHWLCQLGFDAAIVHQQHEFSLTWHGYAVPVRWLADRPTFQASDILVFPEVMVELVRQTRHFAGTRVVIALSWAPAYNRLAVGERWQDLGIEQALTSSPTIQRYLAWSMGLPVTLLPEYVEPARYSYDANQKQLQIAYLTRKEASGEWLQGIFKRKGEPFTRFAWQALRNLDEAAYAQQLRATAIFLPTTMQEGTHISVLEALACGCLVVGYAGVGGHDYLVGAGPTQNALLVENGNLPQLGEQLEGVLRTWLTTPQIYAPILANAVATAQRYQEQAAEQEGLVRFFGQLG